MCYNIIWSPSTSCARDSGAPFRLPHLLDDPRHVSTPLPRRSIVAISSHHETVNHDCELPILTSSRLSKKKKIKTLDETLTSTSIKKVISRAVDIKCIYQNRLSFLSFRSGNKRFVALNQNRL